MGKKSSQARKGKSAAPNSGVDPKCGASTNRASASAPPLHGAGGGSSSSSSGSTPASPAVTASPPSLVHVSSPGASISSSSNPIVRGSPDFPVPPPAAIQDPRMRYLFKLMLDLQNSDLRRDALEKLAKEAAVYPDLAPLLWFSFGTITVILQEVVSVYEMLSPPSLTSDQLKRVCNAIALFQCVASHPETRIFFAQAHIPFYLYMFLNNMGESKPFEHLKLSTLGVIGALLKVPDSRLITFLLSSEVMPLCLKAMESGTEMSRSVATFILQRLLLDDEGLSYVSCRPLRVLAVCQALGNVVAYLADKPSARLLKQVIRCYLRLLDDDKNFSVLRITLPPRLSDGTFDNCLREDETARMWLEVLMGIVRRPHIMQEGSIINMSLWMLSIQMQFGFLKMKHKEGDILQIKFDFLFGVNCGLNPILSREQQAIGQRCKVYFHLDRNIYERSGEMVFPTQSAED